MLAKRLSFRKSSFPDFFRNKNDWRSAEIHSGGAVHSPHILMLSGVGPAAHLMEHNIPLVKDIPGVGSNLRDHLILSLGFRSLAGYSMNPINAKDLASVWLQMKAIAEYKMYGTGPGASNVRAIPSLSFSSHHAANHMV